MVRNTALAAFTAATIAFVGLTAPAQANGHISFNFNPGTTEQANTIRLGLGL